MNSTAIRIVALVALAAMGCVPPPVRRVNRAALVPRLTPSLVDGAPMAQPVELAFGAASLAAARAPGPGDGDEALEVPGTQLAGSVRFRFADYASIGFGYAREAEVDAAEARIRPARGRRRGSADDDLVARVEAHAVGAVDVQVAEQRLPSSRRTSSTPSAPGWAR
jgi:hypothetical protein